MPRDAFGRNIDYLRISLIDRCNLRCRYCMPLVGVNSLASGDLLTPDEIARVVRAATLTGFRKFRLTGGEPMLRKELLEIIERIREIPGVADLAMTTNGMFLSGQAEQLRRAGLNRVNIHLDAVNADRLGVLMRFGDAGRTWAGIAAAEAAGLIPIKLNAVVTRGYNDDEVEALAALTLERPWHVRFIELMPLGGRESAAFAREHFVSSAETRRRLEMRFGPLSLLEKHSASDESVNYRISGARGVVGFISPVSEPFCDDCNRMRLTPNGRLQLCLLRDEEINLQPHLREGASAEELAARIRESVRDKPVGHALKHGVVPLRREMYQIGG